MNRENKFNLNENQEKALVGILYNHISFGTTMEIFGELTSEGIQRLNTLRESFEILLKKYSLDNKLTSETYLLLGMSKMISQERLIEWANDDKNKHMQLRAQYFLNIDK